MEIALECKSRAEDTKPRALRRENMIPANLYGHKGAESISLVLTKKEAISLLRKASINNSLVNLTISDKNWNGPVLIREVQTHPWKRELHHISFFSPSADKQVEVIVPLKLVGKSVGVAQGGVLEQSSTEVNIRCLPDQILKFLEVDISNVDIGQRFQIRDLVLEEGINVLDDPNKSLVNVSAPRKKD